MQRRTFLQTTLALMVGQAFAEGMDMAHHARATLPAGSVFIPPRLKLPHGQPLAPLPRLVNTATELGVFRAKLVAAPAKVTLIPGKQTEVWAYNSQIPGPMIEVVAGTRVEIDFDNQLAQATTVHWHGLPVPADQDGSPHDAVAPGAQRRYTFTVPTDFSGGCWYHPHPHNDTAEQVFRGLAGAFIVRDPHDAMAHLPEQHLLISDLRLDANAQIPPNTLGDWMDGREGQFLLVNGQCQPVLTLAPGSRTRLRIWNATSARQLVLVIPGARLTLVGSDGGLMARPVDVQRLHLAPAERAEVIITAPPKPARLQLVAQPYRRGKMAGKEQTRPLTVLQVNIAGTAAATSDLPGKLRDITALPAATVARRVLLSEGAGAVTQPSDLQFLINDQRYVHDRIDFEGQVGVVEQWEIVNGSAMDHPFHIHGTQFQVVSRDFEGETIIEPVLAWKDTVNLRHTERVTIRFRQDWPGLRMFHCHILEHESLGMMANLMVKP